MVAHFFYGGANQPMEQRRDEDEWNKKGLHRKMPPRRGLKRMRKNVPLLVFVEDDMKTGEICCARWMIVVVFDSIFYTTIIVFGG